MYAIYICIFMINTLYSEWAIKSNAYLYAVAQWTIYISWTYNQWFDSIQHTLNIYYVTWLGSQDMRQIENSKMYGLVKEKQVNNYNTRISVLIARTHEDTEKSLILKTYYFRNLNNKYLNMWKTMKKRKGNSYRSIYIQSSVF